MLVPFVYNEDRSRLVDQDCLFPGENTIAILSSPLFRIDNSLLAFMNSFDYQTWVLIMVSFLALIIINISKTINFESKFYIVLDYFFILLGRGS